jgi:hypothetical protein
MAQEWLRLHRRTVNNPKLQKLGLEVVGFWTNCLCMSDDDGYLPEVSDIAWTMRVAETVAETFLVTLQRNNLVTRASDGRLRLHDWDDHQKRSDTSTDRVRKFREKRQKHTETLDETACNVSETAQSRVDTEKNREEKNREEAREQVRDTAEILEPVSSQAKQTQKRGTRWPEHAVVPDDWLFDGNEARENSGLPTLDLRSEAVKFANYWASKSGGNATKIDWKRTWINWCMDAKGAQNGHGKPNGQHGQTSAAGDVFGRLYATARAQREAAGE